MRYHETAPEPALGDRIECLWTLVEDGRGATPAVPSRVFPDGCIELIVHVGAPWSWRPEGGEFVVQPHAFVVGQLTRPFELRPPSRGGHAFGARLRPGGAFGIAGDALDALADTVTGLDLLWGAEAATDLARRLREAGDDAGRATVMCATLAARAACGEAAHPAILAAVAAILEQRGSRAIAELAGASGWGERQFERRFAREVGCLPRTFARTVRFQHLLSLVGRDERVDWAGLAWDSGFADQAHLIREFRRFTGATPGSFADEALALAREFVTPERLARYFRDGADAQQDP